MHLKNVLACSICLVALLLSGCDNSVSPEDAIADANNSNIKRVANMYNMYLGQNSFQGPADEATFKDWLKNANAEHLKTMGVDVADLEASFVSERDNEPFVIRYGVNGSTRGSQEPVVFEATGVEGKRMVGFLNMVQREVESSEYDQLLNGGAAAANGPNSNTEGYDR
ncbi:MAG: hypothetical protein AAF456_16780 [Planctomycetota bacterium]